MSYYYAKQKIIEKLAIKCTLHASYISMGFNSAALWFFSRENLMKRLVQLIDNQLQFERRL